jgi:hypothetical protein
MITALIAMRLKRVITGTGAASCGSLGNGVLVRLEYKIALLCCHNTLSSSQDPSKRLVLSIENEAHPLQPHLAACSARHSDCIDTSEIMQRLHYPGHSHIRQLPLRAMIRR